MGSSSQCQGHLRMYGFPLECKVHFSTAVTAIFVVMALVTVLIENDIIMSK